MVHSKASCDGSASTIEIDRHGHTEERGTPSQVTSWVPRKKPRAKMWGHNFAD